MSFYFRHPHSSLCHLVKPYSSFCNMNYLQVYYRIENIGDYHPPALGNQIILEFDATVIQRHIEIYGRIVK